MRRCRSRGRKREGGNCFLRTLPGAAGWADTLTHGEKKDTVTGAGLPISRAPKDCGDPDLLEMSRGVDFDIGSAQATQQQNIADCGDGKVVIRPAVRGICYKPASTAHHLKRRRRQLRQSERALKDWGMVIQAEQKLLPMQGYSDLKLNVRDLLFGSLAPVHRGTPPYGYTGRPLLNDF